MSDASSTDTGRRTGKNPGPRTGLRSRQKARLRHVPVTRRVAAWIAAVAHDPATSLKFVIGFAVVHTLLWTIILTALKGAQDVHMDVAEAYAWGQKFLLGYGKHPPLAGWVAGVWFRIFPVTDWATYALAMTVVGTGLVLCWLIAVRVVDHRRAMFSVAMLALYPIFTFKGFKYNPDLLQLVTLPLFVLAYLDAFQKRTWMSGVWLGLAAALALMTKYWVLTMIGAVGLAALIHPDRMRFLRSPAPWLAFVACFIGMLPHLWWLKQADFLPLIYADDVYGGRTFGTTLRLVSIYAAHNIGLLLVPIAFAAIALAWKLQWWKSIRSKGVVSEFIDSVKRPWVRGPNSGVYLSQARHIWIIQIIVGVVPPVAALVFGVYMKTDWGLSLFFLAPLALVALPALRVTQMALIRLMVMWLAFTLVMLLISPIIAAQTVRRDGDAGVPFTPKSEFALQLTEAWRARFNTRWAVVAGTTEIGEPMTFYSPDHPAPFTPREIWASGLTSLEEATRLGFIGICDPRDNQIHICEKWMNDIVPNAERLDLTSRRYFHGKAGPAVKWKIWISGPAKTDDDDK
jgi:4-amino-4-deoxy-L-arabinose transferase-like glycosyltransferase